MKNKIYEGRKLNDFRELVNLYKTEYKDCIAFEYKENPSSKKHIKVTYGQFAKDIETLGANLLNLNCKRVALIGNNRYEWFVSYLAITTAGLVVVPLDKSLPDKEISDLVYRSHSDAIIFCDKYEKAVSVSKKQNSKLLSISMDGQEFKELMENSKKSNENKYNSVKFDNMAMSVILFTSGTTSISKAVMLSQYAICMDLYGLSQIIEITPKDKFLSFLPLHHTFESTTTFLFGSSCGITIAICDGLKYIQQNLVEYEITGFCCVPLMLEIMYKKILKNIEKQHKTFIVNILRRVFRHAPIKIRRKVFKSIIDGLGGKLYTIITGGAAMDLETHQGYNDFGLDIHQGYGLTETSSVLAGENSFSKKVGSVGYPLPTVTLKIDNPDDTGSGEIIAKTPSIMLGYYENEEATSEVLIDGWYHTGDIGHIDKKGFVFITGRKKDMIVLKNGKKIFPEEVENLILKTLPYLQDCMVFGHTDNSKTDRNEDVVLYAKLVYKEDEITKYFPDKDADLKSLIFEDIKLKVNKQMPAYKYIRKILVTDVPLIKTTTQKTKRNDEMKIIEKELANV